MRSANCSTPVRRRVQNVAFVLMGLAWTAIPSCGDLARPKMDVNRAQVVLNAPEFGPYYTLDASVHTPRITNSVIIAYGDRYLDLDPDSDARVRPTIENNEIRVIVDRDPTLACGTLLELRSRDADCKDPKDPAGAIRVPRVDRFSREPAQNWVFALLELRPGTTAHLTNRPGFDFRKREDGRIPNGEISEAAYVKVLKLHRGAVLNTAGYRLYYEKLVDQDDNEMGHVTGSDKPLPNGSRIISRRLLGLHLGRYSMNDPCDPLFAPGGVRTWRRLVGPEDANPPPPGSPLCMGSVRVLPNAVGAGNGVLEMRTRAEGKRSARSVLAKFLFGRAGDEEILVSFRYRFLQGEGTALLVGVSDRPGIDGRSHELARLRPPADGQPGSPTSKEFATYIGRFRRPECRLFSGTFVEFRLFGSDAVLHLDDVRVDVHCLWDDCRNIDEEPGVDRRDFAAILPLLLEPVPPDGNCFDLATNGDGYWDVFDVIAWDAYFEDGSDPCYTGTDRRTVLSSPAAITSRTGTPCTLFVAGKKHCSQDDTVLGFDSNGAWSGFECDPVGAPYKRGNGHLARCGGGWMRQCHGRIGLACLLGPGGCLLPPGWQFGEDGKKVYTGIVKSDGDYCNGLPLMDVAFAAHDRNLVFIAPVIVAAGCGADTGYKAAARFRLSAGGYALEKVYEPCWPLSSFGTCASTPAPDSGFVREVEVDTYGYLYVARSKAGGGDAIFIYRADDSSPVKSQMPIGCTSVATEAAGPIGMTVARQGDYLYLAGTRYVSPSNGHTRLCRFPISRTANQQPSLGTPAYIDLDLSPLLPDPACAHLVSVTSIAESTVDGTLYVVGFSLARPDPTNPACPSYSPGATAIPTKPWLAVVSHPSTAAQASSVANIEANGLALPVSVEFVPAEFGDFDGDGDSDDVDFARFRRCFNGSNRPPTMPDCMETDLDHDGDVDLSDFLMLARCFNGPNRPPACTSLCESERVRSEAMIPSGGTSPDVRFGFTRPTPDSVITGPKVKWWLEASEEEDQYGLAGYVLDIELHKDSEDGELATITLDVPQLPHKKAPPEAEWWDEEHGPNNSRKGRISGVGDGYWLPWKPQLVATTKPVATFPGTGEPLLRKPPDCVQGRAVIEGEFPAKDLPSGIYVLVARIRDVNILRKDMDFCKSHDGGYARRIPVEPPNAAVRFRIR